MTGKHAAHYAPATDGDMSDTFGRHRQPGYFTYKKGVRVFVETRSYEWQQLFERLPK